MAIYHVRSTRNVNMPPHSTPPHPTPQSRYSKTCVLRERFSVRRHILASWTMIWDMGRLCRVRLREKTADLKGASEILCRCPRTTFASAARTLRSNLTLGVDLIYSTLEEPRLYSWLLIFYDPFLGGYRGGYPLVN